jgi:sodium/bile acid cotransporter 7
MPIAIFNATLSSIISVFATGADGLVRRDHRRAAAAPAGDHQDLLLVLLPMALSPSAGSGSRAGRQGINHPAADRAVILAIVFTPSPIGDRRLGGPGRGHAHNHGDRRGGDLRRHLPDPQARLPRAQIDVPDTIACLFCGSVKSLATGVPLARIMFGNDPLLGLIIAPTMLYHVLQLVVLGVLANRYARRTTP